MSIRLYRSFVILAALGVCAFAQETTRVVADAGFRAGNFTVQMGPGDKVVKGAPYTADAVTETVQTLTNGAHITRKSTAQLARDSEGRTRREQTLDAVGPWSTSGEAPKFIILNDPVAGVMYHLDPNTNTAMKLPTGARLGGPDQVFFSSPDGAAGEKIRARAIAGVSVGAGQVTTAMAPMPMGPHSIAAIKMDEPGEAKTESLGQQTIEGILATGTRTTRTIPIGAIGNDQPIEIVSETWYSQDLQMAVMSKHSDPQIGETTYKLTNIQQTEPTHSLFEVPANYTIRDDKPMVFEQSPSTAK